MKRKSSAGRRTHFTKQPATKRPEYKLACHEELEDRKMLAAYINEIYLDPPGGGGDSVFEYVELRGTPSASLADHYLIQVENEGLPLGNPGNIDMIWDLSSYSFGSNGFLTMRQNNPTSNQYTVDPNSTNLVNAVGAGWGTGGVGALAVDEGNDGKIENSGGTFMLIRNDSGAAPALAQDLDTDNNGLDVPTGAAGWTILDAIGIHSEFGEAAAGRLYAPINFGPEASTNIEAGATYVGVGFEIEYIARWGDSTGQTAADWHVSNLTDDPLSGHTAMGDFRQSGDPHGLAINGRRIFYNDSLYDSNTPGAAVADDSAIATDKSAYLPGDGVITDASVTSYSKGINGIMVEIGQNASQTIESSQGVAYGTNLTNTLGTTNTSSAANPEHRAFSLSDFEFSMSGQALSANNTPSTWAAAPAPTLTVFTDTPTVGTDRIELIWPNDTIKNRYLEVTVKGRDFVGGFNTNTGLVQSDIFYFGNQVGDTFVGGDPAFFNTDASDEIDARNNAGIAFTPGNAFDFNRDAFIDASDQILARNNPGFLVAIDISNPPPSPLGDDDAGDSAVVSALAVPASTTAAESVSEANSPGPESSPAASAASATNATLIDVDDPREAVALDEDGMDEILGVDDELLKALAATIRR